MVCINIERIGKFYKVKEEEHYYNWKIRNFIMVQKSEKLVSLQNFEMNTGPTSACQSLWTIGLKMNEAGTHIGFYCKLVGLPGGEATLEELPMGFTATVRYRDGNQIRKHVIKNTK